MKSTDFDFKLWISRFSLESVSNFSVCVCVCVCPKVPCSIRIVLSNLFGFHDLLVEFRYMTKQVRQKSISKLYASLTLVEGEIVWEDRQMFIISFFIMF